MKKLALLVTGVAGLIWVAMATPVFAAEHEGKEVTIAGEAKCAKCALKESEKCQTVIETEKDGKKVSYYLADNEAAKDFHKNVCTGSKKVTATGTVKTAQGKHELTATKIAVAK